MQCYHFLILAKPIISHVFFNFFARAKITATVEQAVHCTGTNMYGLHVWCVPKQLQFGAVFGFFALQIHAPMFEKVGFICKNAPKNGRIKTQFIFKVAIDQVLTWILNALPEMSEVFS